MLSCSIPRSDARYQRKINLQWYPRNAFSRLLRCALHLTHLLPERFVSFSVQSDCLESDEEDRFNRSDSLIDCSPLHPIHDVFDRGVTSIFSIGLDGSDCMSVSPSAVTIETSERRVVSWTSLDSLLLHSSMNERVFCLEFDWPPLTCNDSSLWTRSLVKFLSIPPGRIEFILFRLWRDHRSCLWSSLFDQILSIRSVFELSRAPVNDQWLESFLFVVYSYLFHLLCHFSLSLTSVCVWEFEFFLEEEKNRSLDG